MEKESFSLLFPPLPDHEAVDLVEPRVNPLEYSLFVPLTGTHYMPSYVVHLFMGFPMMSLSTSCRTFCGACSEIPCESFSDYSY